MSRDCKFSSKEGGSPLNIKKTKPSESNKGLNNVEEVPAEVPCGLMEICMLDILDDLEPTCSQCCSDPWCQMDPWTKPGAVRTSSRSTTSSPTPTPAPTFTSTPQISQEELRL